MVRKTKEDAQATITALLDAAERIFSEKGVARTTLNDVALAAGMTRGAIYWHFKDKGDLFQAMCDRVFLPMQTMLNEIAATSGQNPIAALRHVMMHMLIQVTSSAQQRIVFDILFHHCEKNEDMAFFNHETQKSRECLSRLDTIVREAVVQGNLNVETDTWIAVQAINSYLIGLIYEWLRNPQSYDLAQHAEAMIDTFLAGLVAKPPLKLQVFAH